MKIRIFINSSFESDSIGMDNNTLIFYFKSIESYKNFRNTFSLNKEFEDDLEIHYKLTEIIEDLNISQFKKKFKRVKPIVRYYNSNQELENIDIPIIIDLSTLSFNEKLAILTDPKADKENLFFMDEYTTGEYITLNEMIEMYQNILLDCEIIRKNNFSITETLYFIYSKYKERIYKEEGKREKSSISRSLNQIMKRDNIVCVGYSNYLNAIASILNIPVFPLSWTDASNPNSGHQENIAIINDPKYDIKGIFTIDITWDSKRNADDEEYQNNIKHFLVPAQKDLLEKTKKRLVLPVDNIYYSAIYKYQRYKRFNESNVPNAILWDNKRIAFNAFNKLHQILGLPPIKGDCDLEIEINKIKKLGTVRIPEETLKNIINSVTPKSEEELDTILQTSYHYITPKERLFSLLLAKRK